MAKAKATKGKSGITAKQREARKKNMAIARASKASGKKKKAKWAAAGKAAMYRAGARKERKAMRRLSRLYSGPGTG